jgi:putative FmdB family regulatory protein
MADYEFVCHECGRVFRGLTSRIGEAMCPACGSIDIERVAAPSVPAAQGAAPDAPDKPARPDGRSAAPGESAPATDDG